MLEMIVGVSETAAARVSDEEEGGREGVRTWGTTSGGTLGEKTTGVGDRGRENIKTGRRGRRDRVLA